MTVQQIGWMLVRVDCKQGLWGELGTEAQPVDDLARGLDAGPVGMAKRDPANRSDIIPCVPHARPSQAAVEPKRAPWYRPNWGNCTARCCFSVIVPPVCGMASSNATESRQERRLCSASPIVVSSSVGGFRRTLRRRSVAWESSLVPVPGFVLLRLAGWTGIARIKTDRKRHRYSHRGRRSGSLPGCVYAVQTARRVCRYIGCPQRGSTRTVVGAAPGQRVGRLVITGNAGTFYVAVPGDVVGAQ